MMAEATDIFLSYKAEDRQRLQPLVDALEEAGFSLWWDQHIGGGANWRQEIEDHLDAARCVIVAWSKRSIGPEGDFVRDEAARAKRRGSYFPICIDDVSPPLGFGEVQAHSLKGWKGNRSDSRVAAIVAAIRQRLGVEAPLSRAILPSEPLVSRRAIVAGAIGAGGLALAGVAGWSLWPGQAPAHRIAVLPFANLSNDPAQLYFSDGIAEELRSALSRLGMEVIGRASSDAVKHLDTRTAAGKLDVAHILTGSVRRSPELIRITAQLVSGSDGVERWAQTYDRAPGDAIRIQADIAENVARALSIALGQAGRAAVALGGTADSLAQDLVLRGRERWVTAASPDEFGQALALTEAAIRRDGNYAAAHVQRAMILTSTAENYPSDASQVERWLAQAEAAAGRASRIAPRLGSAHVALAKIAQNRFDLRGLFDQTRKALALSPDDPNVLLDASTTMAMLARGEEGLRLADRLIALDRLNARAFARRSGVLLYMRRYREAIEAVNQANAIAPGNASRAATAGDSWLLLGHPDKARAEYAKMPADDYQRITSEAIAALGQGNRREAELALTRLDRLYGPTVSYQYALIHAHLGDKDRAFVELDRALAMKDPGLFALKVDAFLDPLRDDPRFAALVKRLNFP